jgi:type IV pilus assembly protein PilE
MIAVAVVAILAAIAIPSYRTYFVRANRSAAESLMLDLANREHQFFSANRAYATASDLNFSMPADLSPKYTGAIALDAGPPPGFTITFTPVVGGGQDADGTLTLDSVGNKTPAEKWQR